MVRVHFGPPLRQGQETRKSALDNSPVDCCNRRGFSAEKRVHFGPPNGGIAQLGERLNGIQEVSGSIPLISTNLIDS